MDISLFTGFYGKPHLPTGKTTINDFLIGIKHGVWREAIEPINKETDPEKRKKLKTKLASVTISGLFSQRDQQHLVQHSGFICIDIDNYTEKEELAADPYTYALFKSASGQGLAVIVKVTPEKHKECFEWLANYYFASFGISVDCAPQNIASLRFVSYDPDIVINDKSRKAKTMKPLEPKNKTVPIILPTNVVEELIAEVCKRNIDLAPDYHSYLRLGFALADGFGEGGRNYFHQLCQINSKYNFKQAEGQYTRCIKGGKSGITVGTFYHMIKTAGIELPKPNKKAIATATVAKKAGRSKESIKAQLIEMDNLPEVEAEQIVTEIMNRKEFDINNNAKDPEDLIPALVEWLQMNHPLRLNMITGKLEENGTEFKNERLNTIYLRARIFFNSKEITKDLIESIVFSDNIPQFNPIQEWIEKHRHLKTSGNIDKLCSTITTDTQNANIWIRKWFLSLIAAYDGNPVRSVLALVGGQHTGKTEWFRRLLPDELRKYYAESKLDAGKDDEILMCQKLIVMDDEMGGKSKQDEKRFKELTSKNTFTLRAPYGRYNEDYKRLAVLCGTSNPIEILSDPTGNTRILPVHVLAINHDLYNSINKSEMLMEAVRAYESGEQWQLNKSEFDDLNMQSLEYEKTPFERELIIKHLRKPEKDEYFKEMTATEIKNYIEGNSMQRIMNMTRFGIELKNVFGKSKMLRKNGVVSRYYEVVTADVTGLNNEPVTPQNNDNEDFMF